MSYRSFLSPGPSIYPFPFPRKDRDRLGGFPVLPRAEQRLSSLFSLWPQGYGSNDGVANFETRSFALRVRLHPPPTPLAHLSPLPLSFCSRDVQENVISNLIKRCQLLDISGVGPEGEQPTALFSPKQLPPPSPHNKRQNTSSTHTQGDRFTILDTIGRGVVKGPLKMD